MNHPEIKALILDMDGVLWRDDQSIGNLPSIFSEISRRNLKVTLATNNATLSVRTIPGKTGTVWSLVTAGADCQLFTGSAHYLTKRFPDKGNVISSASKDSSRPLSSMAFTHSEEGVLAVIGSLDRQLTFEKLRQATMIIRRSALHRHKSRSNLSHSNGLDPGAGTILAAIEAATRCNP